MATTFIIKPQRLIEPGGLSLLPRQEQREQLNQDTSDWLDSGHIIKQLPPGPATYSGRFDSFSHLMIETGLFHEF